MFGGRIVDTLFAKLQEYLQMEEEISFEEFSRYYKDLMDLLNKDFSGLNQDECLKARYICSIVQANAETRSKNNKVNAKAFKKMNKKCAFWGDAINYRLLKEGLSQQQIDEATAAF
jgi:hypothetical protein